MATASTLLKEKKDRMKDYVRVGVLQEFGKKWYHETEENNR